MASSNIEHLGTDDYRKLYTDKHISKQFYTTKSKNFIACLGTSNATLLDLNFCIRNNIDDNFILYR